MEFDPVRYEQGYPLTEDSSLGFGDQRQIEPPTFWCWLCGGTVG